MNTQHSFVPRIVADKLVKLFANFPVVVVVGARQVGKSSILSHTFPNIPSVVFDPVIDVENARKDPELFLSNKSVPLILDEIQYAPELVPVIKRRIDKDRRPGQYLITGSQQWEVMKELSESLSGRAIIVEMEGFSLIEIANADKERCWLKNWLQRSNDIAGNNVTLTDLPFTTYEQLWRGFLPEAQFVSKDLVLDYLSSYQKTYIERDVRQMAEVSDLQLFMKFFRLASALSAQEVNFSQIGREIGITPQTASRWLNILGATFQWFELQAYSGNTIKRISDKPKGYISDTGLICVSHAISTPDVVGHHPLWGAMFETAIVNDIRRQAQTLNMAPNFYHWRSHGGAEVDLLIEWNGEFFPIEIKGKSNPTKGDARGIEAFKETYPRLSIQRGLIVAPAGSFYPVRPDVFVMPWNAIII